MACLKRQRSIGWVLSRLVSLVCGFILRAPDVMQIEFLLVESKSCEIKARMEMGQSQPYGESAVVRDFCSQTPKMI